VKIDERFWEDLFGISKMVGVGTSNWLGDVGRTLVGRPTKGLVREWLREAKVTDSVEVTPDFTTPITQQLAQANIIALHMHTSDLEAMVFTPPPQPSVKMAFLTSPRAFTIQQLSEIAMLKKMPTVSLPTLLAVWRAVAEVRPRSPIIGLDSMIDHQDQQCLPGISWHRGNPGCWRFELLPWWLELRASCRLAIILPGSST